MVTIGHFKFNTSHLARQWPRGPPATTLSFSTLCDNAQPQTTESRHRDSNQKEGFSMQVYRQGDVSIIAIKGLPRKTKRVQGEPILARGEVTGHAHRMVEGTVRLYQLAGFLYLRVLSEFAKLYHEEHADIVLFCTYEPCPSSLLTCSARSLITCNSFSTTVHLPNFP